MTNEYVFIRTRQAFLENNVKVANTHWSRFRGLIGQNVTTFRAGSALWLLPSHGVHTFFMSMPIDLVYLDDELSVVHIEENVGPWRLAPVLTQVISVLELPSHTVYESDTKVGDALEITLEHVAMPQVVGL